MSKITILTITTHTQYRDMQAEALKLQTFQDFEWIVVDDFVERNNTALREAVNNAFKLIHIPPVKIVPYYAACMASNTGLIHASGELIYFMSDYILPQKNCLEQHWNTHQKYPGHFVSGLAFTSTKGEEGGILNLEDIKDAKDERNSELLFSGKYGYRKLEEGIFLFDRSAVRAWWAGKNDSVSLKALIDVNGFEERLDGARQDADANLAERLYNYGLRYILDNHSAVIELSHMGAGKESHPNPELKRKLLNDAVFQNIYLATHERNLQEERNQCPTIEGS